MAAAGAGFSACVIRGKRSASTDQYSAASHLCPLEAAQQHRRQLYLVARTHSEHKSGEFRKGYRRKGWPGRAVPEPSAVRFDLFVLGESSGHRLTEFRTRD